MSETHFLSVAHELEDVGLLWQPEIGDEVFGRFDPQAVSVLVDTAGKRPNELRESYLWLPTVEQMILQIEVRQGILFHAGLELSESSFCYKTVIHARGESVQATGISFRNSVGRALRDLLLVEKGNGIH